MKHVVPSELCKRTKKKKKKYFRKAIVGHVFDVKPYRAYIL